ncbi:MULTISPECIES: aldo/keto reductase [Actinomyces]|uniref:Aldo/keto reductase n=1 Tax=Actinomyces respiraculi TaxID=2744574 RepID=A0A7T0PUR7_9ACTO|nr:MULTISPECIES: aldo/keto reductase [Actinomyces]QPL04461.1 aldo/keto reductase [Actinomyces respiraculi]
MSKNLHLPAIGLGTYNLRGREDGRAVTSAIAVGYRLIDSAFSYENEGIVAEGVARAVDEGHAAREELVVTSKVPGRHFGRDRALWAVEESAARMRPIGPIDLYLIHWPNPAQDLYVDTWRALIEAREQGLVRHIGVSNFLPEHIARLEDESGVLPAVNQIESHPRFPNTEQIAYDASRGILTEAWSPIGRSGELLTDPVVAAVAQAHGVTPAQAVLAWHVARGVTPIPKSSSPQRQAENLAAADVVLTAEEVAALTALGRPDGRLKGQDPAVYEEM